MAILKKNKKEKTATEKVAVKDAEKKASKKLVSKKALETIVRPVVSEKAANVSADDVVTLIVKSSANKVEIRNAVREMYGVTPTQVNTVNMRGKAVRFGRFSGKRSDIKKAYITLPKGTSLDIFEGV